MLPGSSPTADLALAALLAGYAIGTTGLAVHHAVCQTIVRTCHTAHAETNAVMLPHSARFMAERAPSAIGEFARALGDPAGKPGSAADRIAALAAPTGVTRLSDLGVTAAGLDKVSDAAARHPAITKTPGGVTAAQIRDLLRAGL